ncbi:MAG: amidinotransferase, partial [Gammaproteobacteria bacterium]|nr:amidinotransferase [Gammaproteobacteria bacterium]
MLMSQAAHDALNPDQIKTIEEFNKIVASPIPTIEYCGGGSVRCMLAEVFLPKGEKNV